MIPETAEEFHALCRRLSPAIRQMEEAGIDTHSIRYKNEQPGRLPAVLALADLMAPATPTFIDKGNMSRRAIIQLCRCGDIVSILPVAKYLADQGHDVTMVTHVAFTSILDAVSYVKVLPFHGLHRDVNGAAVEAGRHGFSEEEIIRAQVNGNTQRSPIEAENLQMEQWARAGSLDLYHDLPLVFDRRNAAAEQQALRQHLPPDDGRPLLAYNLEGHSSRYPHVAAQRKWILETFGEQYRLLDLGALNLDRPHYLLAFLEVSEALITIDTLTVHLAHATSTPTLVMGRGATLAGEPTTYYFSEPRVHWVFRCTYEESVTSAGRDEMARIVKEKDFAPGRLIRPTPKQYRDNILSGMKAPGDYRHGIWRGRILQVKVTNACDLDCKNCSVGVGLARKLKKIFRMTPEQFRTALRSLRGFPGVIGMFGGNPCIHPQFDELCAIFREEIPNKEQRGLWSNNLFGKGRICRETFHGPHCNLNVHQVQLAWDEIKRDWPEARPIPCGLTDPSTHGPIFGSMEELGVSKSAMWRKIGSCYVNQTWSAEITAIDGKLAGYFCEIAATMAEMTGDAQHGVAVEPGWWSQPMTAFEHQVHQYCTRCLVPMNARKIDAASDQPEEYTAAWTPIMATIKGRPLKLVTQASEIQGSGPATQYLPRGVMGRIIPQVAEV